MNKDLDSLVPKDWHCALESVRSELTVIDELLTQAMRVDILVTPARENIFASLNLSPENVSVVVIGQDPYPTPGYATGLAFGVPVGTQPLPGSLRNIFKEIESDTSKPPASDCTLENWTNQGVLLLNTSLTTESGVRAAHANWPWDPVIRAVLKHVVESNPEVVAVLWGNHAKQFAQLFHPTSIVVSAHPSPLSASRGFLGSKPFSRVNEILLRHGKPVIVW